MSGQRSVLCTPELAWPAQQGSRLLQLDVARALRELGPVDWVTRDTGGLDEAKARLRREGFQLELDGSFRARDPVRRLLRRASIDWRALRSHRPRELAFVAAPGVRRAFARRMAAHPDALAVGVYWSTWPCLLAAPRSARVLVLADIEHAAAEDGIAAGDQSRSQGSVAALRRAELDALGSCALALCLTDEDVLAARALVSGMASPPHVDRWPVAIPIPAEAVGPPPRSPGRPLRLFCFGHWHAAFNRDGLESFLRDEWPALREAVPDLELVVAGRGLEAFPRSQLPGVEWRGWVDDLGSAIRESDAVVIPMRYGGGLRYRLLEAMALGRVVVASPVAAAGSGATPGEHYLAAGDARSWQQAIRRLGGEECRGIERAAREFVHRRYGGQGRQGRLREILSGHPGEERGTEVRR